MADSNLLGPWIRRFLLEHLVGERGLSINTQKSYRDMLILLLPFIAKQANKSTDRLVVTDLSAESIRLFLQELETVRNCAISTRNQRLAGIHALARFIGQHCPEFVGWCGQVRLIPFKRTTEPTITALDREQVTALLEVPVRSTTQGQRDYALLLFLYNSGARASEAVGLSIDDIDWHAQCVKVLGKGKKHRFCPLWPITLEVLKAQTAERKPSEPVFLNRTGRPITRSGVHALVKRCAKRASANVPSLANKTVGPHVIRHSTATHLLRSGVDINTIRGWLGHVSLDTTNIYAEINLEAKAKALATCTFTDKQGSETSWRKQPELMEFLRNL